MIMEERKGHLPHGEEVVFKSAKEEDGELLYKHTCITAGETYFLAKYPEEYADGLERMKKRLAGIQDEDGSFMLAVFMNGQIIGDLWITRVRSHLKYLHRASMGIMIEKAYWHLGLGRMMIGMALEQAKKNGFEQVELGVYADNLHAIHLYEKMGFKQYGVLPRAFKLKDGSYRSEVLMVLVL